MIAWVLVSRHASGQTALPAAAGVQSGSSSAARQPSPRTGLSSSERARFDTAQRLFAGQHDAEALDGFKELLPQLQAGSPAYSFVAKFASEAAINTGDRAFALQTLKPIEQADANDWQAASLLARAYAESGDGPQRDREIARLSDLQRRAVDPQFAKLGQFQLERIVLPNGSMRVWYSLTPWGVYHVYVFARVYDAAEQQMLRLTLESGDFDQPGFAKEHPDLAARGERAFSLDGYGPDAHTADGQLIQSHYTYGSFEGQPNYDTVRRQMIEAAEGVRKPISERVGPVR